MRRPSKLRIQGAFQRHPALDYRPPFYLRAARWSVVVVVLGALLTALYVGVWYYAAGQLRDGTLAWVEARRQEGVSVRFERLDIGGFPFRLRLTAIKPAISFPKATAPWGWEGDAVTATLRPWNFRRITLRAPGTQAAIWTEGGKPRTVHGQFGTSEATLHLSDGRLDAVQLDLADVSFAGDAPITRLTVGQGHLDADLTPQANATEHTPIGNLRLSLRDLGTPPDWRLPLGNAIAAANANATLVGALPPGPLSQALTHWRDDGGTVEVHHLGLTYGPLLLTADGTLALDAAMQPIGAFTARAKGFFETVDALRTHGLIRSRDAVTAKLVLGALAKRGDNGRASLTMPLTIQDQTLFAGPVPLAKIPTVHWPEAKPAK